MSLEILGDAKGPVLATVPASRSDLTDCVGELWLESHLRAGHPEVPRDALSVRLLPARRKGTTAKVDASGGMLCDGFILETDGPDGSAVRRVFIPDAMKLRALRVASRLIAEGVLEPEQTFRYRLRVDPSAEGEAPGAEPHAEGFVARESSPPLAYRRVPLAPFLERSASVDDGGDPLHRIVYLESALALAEAAARRGVAENPPIETGALLIGSLCSCPASGEFFCLVEDVLEAVDADGTATSLTFSSKTWARIHTIMKARGEHPETRLHRVIGNSHGHPFKPCTPEACKKCPDAGACAHLSSSAFLSIDDVRWMKSVFPGEPWSFCHVFGLSTEGEPTEALYSGFAGWMIRRGYHVIADALAREILADHPEGV
jgi:hypothetical protein